MTVDSIQSLKDLENLRSAPILEQNQADALFAELLSYCKKADWFTVGIMAPSAEESISSLRQVERRLDWSELKIVSSPDQTGPVFLKANQSSGDVHIRIEHGLGEGILLGCQHKDPSIPTKTLGPFPLDFFRI